MTIHTTTRKNYEAQLISEYCLARFPSDTIKIDVPLGSTVYEVIDETGTVKQSDITRPFRPRIDAIVITPEKMILIEAKLMRILDGLCKLPFYRDLIDSTPELSAYVSLPREMVFVSASVPGWSARLAARHDIRIDYYHPAWIHDYNERIQIQNTGAARQGRADRQNRLRALGYTELAG